MLEQLEKIHGEMVNIRRHFHMNPELSYKEVETPAYITKYLQNLGIEDIRTNVGGRGVVATIKGKNPGKTVALRADFDALPIPDEKDVPYKSTVPGVMHACGHDGHTASLLGVAKVLSQNTDKINGSVRLIFQFAEEKSPGGAIEMIKDGCMDGVDAVFGSHLSTKISVGEYGYRAGAFMAMPDEYTITIKGKGGHGAAPHQTIDSIVVAANLVINLQQIVSRRIDPLKPAVVTVGQINGGNAFNVIADSATIVGTVRTYDDEVQKIIQTEMERITKATCDLSGATFEIEYLRGYPAVINDKASTELVTQSLKKIVNPKKVIELEPSMGGEDFAYYLQKVPGCFFNTGAGNEERGIIYPHHHPKFDIDENGLLFASKALLTIALDYLSEVSN
ncbi:MAG: M20 family metallopeptidase [Defluviitaleaceae bacterium]|nr:M20 family metallopeptidase [Defluviitaleaceae bacterium]